MTVIFEATVVDGDLLSWVSFLESFLSGRLVVYAYPGSIIEAMFFIRIFCYLTSPCVNPDLVIWDAALSSINGESLEQ